MKLKNTRHELFAQGLAKGMSAIDAYVEAGGPRSEATVCRIAKRDDIQARVAELQARHAAQCDVTVESLTEQFDSLTLKAIEKGQISAAVSAVEKKAKLHGFLTTSKVQHTGKDDGPIQVEEIPPSQRLKEYLARIAPAPEDE